MLHISIISCFSFIVAIQVVVFRMQFLLSVIYYVDEPIILSIFIYCYTTYVGIRFLGTKMSIFFVKIKLSGGKDMASFFHTYCPEGISSEYRLNVY